jgi:hypothetical protein
LCPSRSSGAAEGRGEGCRVLGEWDEHKHAAEYDAARQNFAAGDTPWSLASGTWKCTRWREPPQQSNCDVAEYSPPRQYCYPFDIGSRDSDDKAVHTTLRNKHVVFFGDSVRESAGSCR